MSERRRFQRSRTTSRSPPRSRTTRRYGHFSKSALFRCSRATVVHAGKEYGSRSARFIGAGRGPALPEHDRRKRAEDDGRRSEGDAAQSQESLEVSPSRRHSHEHPKKSSSYHLRRSLGKGYEIVIVNRELFGAPIELLLPEYARGREGKSDDEKRVYLMGEG